MIVKQIKRNDEEIYGSNATTLTLDEVEKLTPGCRLICDYSSGNSREEIFYLGRAKDNDLFVFDMCDIDGPLYDSWDARGLAHMRPANLETAQILGRKSISSFEVKGTVTPVNDFIYNKISTRTECKLTFDLESDDLYYQEVLDSLTE